MAVLTVAQSDDLIKDRAGFNVSVDSPVSAAELLRFQNEAYADMWEIEGGSRKVVAHATAWSVSPTADTSGVLVGILADINEILRVWQSSTSGSVGDTAGDVELIGPVDLARIRWERSKGTALGIYTGTKIWAATRMATTTAADVNKMRLDVYPGVSGAYYPIEYIPQFTPVTTGTDVYDLTDLGSRDLVLLAALKIVPLLGRSELYAGIANDISERTRLALERKYGSLSSGDQDSSRRER